MNPRDTDVEDADTVDWMRGDTIVARVLELPLHVSPLLTNS